MFSFSFLRGLESFHFFILGVLKMKIFKSNQDYDLSCHLIWTDCVARLSEDIQLFLFSLQKRPFATIKLILS